MFYVEENFWPHDTTLWVKDFKGNSPRFVYYFFKSIAHELKRMDVGAANPTLNRNHVHPIPVLWPSSATQQAITHILGTLDDKIELNRRMNETLESMARALFKSWFVDFDPVIDNALAAGHCIPEPLAARAETRRALGPERKPLPENLRSLFPATFAFDEEMGWIPEGWTATSVKDSMSINPTVSLKKGTVAKYADMKALPTSGFAVGGITEKAYSGGTKFESNDVLMARITPCIENGKAGVVDFLDDGEIGFGSTEFNVLRKKDGVGMPFIAALVRDENFRAHGVANMVGSSGRQRVQGSCFETYFLALPDETEVLEQYDQSGTAYFKNHGSQT